MTSALGTTVQRMALIETARPIQPMVLAPLAPPGSVQASAGAGRSWTFR